MKKPIKEDFKVYEPVSADKDYRSYNGVVYNHYMYKEALRDYNEYKYEKGLNSAYKKENREHKFDFTSFSIGVTIGAVCMALLINLFLL